MNGLRRVRGRPADAAALGLSMALCLGLGGLAAAQEPGDRTPPASEVGETRGADGPDRPKADTTEAPESLNSRLARLAKLQFDLERELDSASLDVASARRRFEAAQQRLDSELDPSEVLREEVAARRLELEAAQRIAALLEGRIERRASEEETWRRLHELDEGSVSPERLAEWLAEAERAQDALAREAVVKGDRLAEVERDLAYTREQVAALPPGSPLQRWAEVRREALEELELGYLAEVEGIGIAQAQTRTLMERTSRAREELSLSDRLRIALHSVREAWNYRLTGAEPEPITLGKVIAAVVIFVIGWLVARVVASLLGSRVLPRLRMEEGVAHAFESLAFYVLLLVAFLTALRMVDIPLTAFAVVGGALAIGVGFGSQNVVNNFISGIILLAERPIKRNDLVEVEGIFGNVEQIGLRSTRVRTGENVHIIVPNASFLENNVVNWTHSDSKVRVTISVGVAYGSPTREVLRLLQKAVDEQPGVLPQPEPVALFVDFGDNALGFEVRFWIVMPTVLARMRIQSEIRLRIDDLLREAGITIAFPQRDVHLDSVSPVEVRLLGDTPRAGDGAADDGKT